MSPLANSPAMGLPPVLSTWAERFTASGIADQVGALGVGARLLRDEVLVGMGERETELRERLAVLDPGSPQQPAITRGRDTPGRESPGRERGIP